MSRVLMPIVHYLAVGDTRVPLSVTLTRPNGDAIDLTGLTVKFYAVDEDGAEAIAETETGVSVTDADAGQVQYDFQDADVETARRLYAYFRIYDGAEFERIPVKAGDLIINIQGDTP